MRPQGTCTIAAANSILNGLAIVVKEEVLGGVDYIATMNNGAVLRGKGNTRLVSTVIDYAIENGIFRSHEGLG